MSSKLIINTESKKEEELKPLLVSIFPTFNYNLYQYKELTEK